MSSGHTNHAVYTLPMVKADVIYFHIFTIKDKNKPTCCGVCVWGVGVGVRVGKEDSGQGWHYQARRIGESRGGGGATELNST